MDLVDDIPTNCLPVSAKELGLSNAAFTPLVVPTQNELELLESSVRYKALIQTDLLAHQLAVAAGAATATITQKQSAVEFLSKLARLDQKKQETASNGPGYQLVINIGDTTTRISAPMTIEQEQDNGQE